jgi:hypothetical protein
MRLVVARYEVADGSVLVQDDADGYKPHEST